jgi:hypothetical protein
MKSKLTLLSLFLAATLITSQVSAAEEKTTTVDTIGTADKSPDKSASTDTTAPDADEAVPEGVDTESVSAQIVNDIIKILLKEVGASKALATIQERVCKAGLSGAKGCTPSLSNATIRACGGIMCQSNNVGLNTAIIALCGDYKDFMSSACAKKMGSGKTDVKTARKIVCETALNNDVFNEIKTILKYTPNVCPSN